MSTTVASSMPSPVADMLGAFRMCSAPGSHTHGPRCGSSTPAWSSARLVSLAFTLVTLSSFMVSGLGMGLVCSDRHASGRHERGLQVRVHERLHGHAQRQGQHLDRPPAGLNLAKLQLAN